jgi:hypothetical protein
MRVYKLCFPEREREREEREALFVNTHPPK